MTSSGTFDILTFKGIEKSIQGLFSKHASQDGKGQIVFEFFDLTGRSVDCEILSLHRSKQASHGVSALSLSVDTRSIFISDSYPSLIYFANQYQARISFDDAGFLVIGAEFNRRQMRETFNRIPLKAKVNTVFTTSILGRVMDCKIQDLVHRRDCTYHLANDLIQLKNLRTKKVTAESMHSFSLRTYCISQGLKQTVRTFKPKQKVIESFYQLNQVHENNV